MPRWTEDDLRRVVSSSDSYADVLRAFGLRAAGGNFRLLKRWLERWDIPSDHFTHGGRRRSLTGRVARPLGEVLVADSSYHRGALKQRLYDTGLKARRCELCGQGEEWRGARMALILDHVNGVADDNRLENLRVVCPNCNATLPTHCGGNRPRTRGPRECVECGASFLPGSRTQRFCSRECWQRTNRGPRPEARKVERPPHDQLLAEIAATSWSAVARRLGVSDNAVRKWVQAEQQHRAAAAPGERRGAA